MTQNDKKITKKNDKKFIKKIKKNKKNYKKIFIPISRLFL
jgi:hypothetical protein